VRYDGIGNGEKSGVLKHDFSGAASSFGNMPGGTAASIQQHPGDQEITMQAATKIEQNTHYGLTREVDMSYEDAVSRITETLKEQGFGILTEIDVKTTLKKKLDKDFTKYVILGACNPNLAFQALSNEIDIGLLLPCNVVVYEKPDTGKTVVGVLDPDTMVNLTGRDDIKPVAAEARQRLETALQAL